MADPALADYSTFESAASTSEITESTTSAHSGHFIGPHCQRIGIDGTWVNTDIYLPSTSKVLVTIGVILELKTFKRKKQHSDKEAAEWVRRLFSLETTPASPTIQRQWGRLATRVQKLRSNKLEKEKLMSSKYTPPNYENMITTGQGPMLSPTDQTNESIATQTENCRSDKIVQCDIPQNNFPSLAMLAESAVNKLKSFQSTKIDDLISVKKKQLQKLKEKFSSMTSKIGHYRLRNVNKRDKRLKQKLSENKKLCAEIVELKRAKNNALKVKSKWVKKMNKLENKIRIQEQTAKSTLSNLNDTIRDLEWQLSCKFEDNLEGDQLKISNGNIVQLKNVLEVRSGKMGYSDDVRLLYMRLLSLGVPVSKCSDVVRSVIEGFTDKTLPKLPAKSTTSSFQSECEVASDLQVAEKLFEGKSLTLQLDGTKKRFKEFGAFQISAEDSGVKKTLSLGIREMVKGDTESYLDTMSSVFTDVAETFSDDAERIDKIKAKMISNVKNLMTDRHVVNKSFKTQFENLRKDLFEKHLETYNSMQDSEKKRVVELHGLFCGLHVIGNMGNYAAKGLKVYEDIALPPEYKISEFAFEKGNARAFDFIFELSQSLTISGSQRFGRYADWEAYLQEKGEGNRIVSFLRHRFNVLFVNGGAVYYHRHHITDFFSSQEPNRLIRCILDTIKSSVCIAEVRALGIFSVLISQPLWRAVERDDIHIFDLNVHWLKLRDSLSRFSRDATELLNQQEIFPQFAMKKDAVYECLFQETTSEDCEINRLTKECLQVMCFHVLQLVERQLTDQLPGGIYGSPDATVWQDTKSTPTTNRSGEKDFSDLDREVNRAPQRNTNHISGVICFRNNHTWNYFRAMTPEKRRKCILRTIKLGPIRRKRNQERKVQVRKIRNLLLQEKKAKRAEKERKKKAELDEVITYTEETGRFTTENLNQKLEVLKTKAEKIKSIKYQLKYHRLILKSEADRSLFAYSADRKQHSIEVLKSNLERVISEDQCLEPKVTKSGDCIFNTENSELRSVSQRRTLIQNAVKTKNILAQTAAKLLIKARKHKLREIYGNVGIAKIPKRSKPIVISSVGHVTDVSAKVDHNLQLSQRHQTSSSKSCKKKVKCVQNKNRTEHETDILIPQVFESTDKDTFVCVAYEDTWYVGQVEKILSDASADVRFMKRVGYAYFKWPSKLDQKEINEIFVLRKGLTISPNDSSLRIWSLPSSTVHELEKQYDKYKINFFTHKN